jgi:cytochrome c553
LKALAKVEEGSSYLKEVMLADKLEAVKNEAIQKFAKPGLARGVKAPSGAGQAPSKMDPRLLDYIYEVVFSIAAAPPAQGLGGKEPTLEAARGMIFSLPDFKTAADRVAYGEDLLTRAVSLLEGMTRCRLCGSNNTTFTVRQMHSSDEAPTMMLYCGSCHHRTNQTGE